jgi:hypothetical protein
MEVQLREVKSMNRITARWMRLAPPMILMLGPMLNEVAGDRFSGAPLARPADSHRVLVLDFRHGGRAGNGENRLLVVGIESGKVLAAAAVGFNPNLALSADRKVIAAAYWSGLPHATLDFYRTSDLKLVERGLLQRDVLMAAFQTGGAFEGMLSPGGREMLLHGGTFPPPPKRPVAGDGEGILSCVSSKPGPDRFFPAYGQRVHIPRTYDIKFLRSAEWPRLQVWDPWLGSILVANVQTAKLVGHVCVSGDADVARLPFEKVLEQDAGWFLRHVARGWMLADGGRYCYFLSPVTAPQVPPERRIWKKVDLAVDPPRVVAQRDLLATEHYVGAVVSNPAQRMLLARFVDDSRPYRVQVLSTSDLQLQRELELPFGRRQLDWDRQPLTMSRDGRWMYALDQETAKLAVLDLHTGHVVKVIEHVGDYPGLVESLPDT